MSIVVTPIPRLIDLAAPAFTLGTANAAGSAATAVASDSTLLAFDTTLPDAITYGQSGAVGSSATAARRSHAHAMAAEPTAYTDAEAIAAVEGESTLVLTGSLTAGGTLNMANNVIQNIGAAGVDFSPTGLLLQGTNMRVVAQDPTGLQVKSVGKCDNVHGFADNQTFTFTLGGQGCMFIIQRDDNNAAALIFGSEAGGLIMLADPNSSFVIGNTDSGKVAVYISGQTVTVKNYTNGTFACGILQLNQGTATAYA